MPLPPSPIGFDASVLINFCAVQRLDLLVATSDSPGYVLVDVLEELEPNCRRQVNEMVTRGLLVATQVAPGEELRRWAQYNLRLDTGESATLAVAVERGWSIAVDERAARRIAERDLGRHRLTGTVGILVAAIKQGHLTAEEGEQLLQAMAIEANYWSPVSSLQQALLEDSE